MEKRCVPQFVATVVLSAAIVLSATVQARAIEQVVGTIQVSGPAWVASPNEQWSRLSSARPLVAGDRLKTGSDGYLLADLGDAGVVGLYGNAEVFTHDQGGGPIVDVQRGKVAFHMSPNSRMKLNAQGSGIASGAQAVDGYVEYDASGTPVVVVEDGSLQVSLAAGSIKTVSRGESLTLTAQAPAEKPDQLAAADEDVRRAGAAASEGGGTGGGGAETYAGLSVAGWSAVAVVSGAIGGAIYSGVDNDDRDRDSPSGD